MERGSVQHGPRLDDELEGEVEDATPVTTVTTVRSWTTDRSELARHLRPAVFPARRDQLIAVACDEGAPEPIVRALEQLPAARQYGSVGELWRSLGHEAEQRTTREPRRRPGSVREIAARSIRLLGTAMEVAGRATSRAARVLEPGPSR
jgi:hypothetical protein